MPTAAGDDRRIVLAAVAGVHGVKGEVRLKLFGQGVASIAAHGALVVGGRLLGLKSVRASGGGAVARFAGVVDRVSAEALRGLLVEVERSALEPLGDGEYYHADLLGLACINGAGEPLGTVVAVENYGAGDLLEIEGPDGRRSLIPFRDGIADLVEGQVRCDPQFLA